ncbi:unnamed protein product [Allacma fusca]|uniref:Glucuronosyltransferase n=1 Tax=Allacma fusca TaxID=39272 RepID=A0A8J2LHS2_9HEXA|nr:unnamed protein product [Allacma fusca]
MKFLLLSLIAVALLLASVNGAGFGGGCWWTGCQSEVHLTNYVCPANVRRTFVDRTIIVATNFDLALGAKILSVSFVSTKSHYLTYEALLLELAERGHEVTIANSIKSSKEVKNVRRIYTYDSDIMLKGISPKTYKAKETTSKFWSHFNVPFMTYYSMWEEACKASYKMEAIQKLRKEKFDLIIFPPLWNDCAYGLIHELNTSVILYNQMAIMPWVSSSMGSPSLPSFVPMMYYNFPDNMTFFERVGNFFGTVFYHVVKTYYYEPGMEKVYREGLGNPNLPSIKDIEKNASLALVNSNINFVPPRPLTPDIIEVGGLYLRDAEPLPKDLQAFCDGAGNDGIILLSFGSILKVSAMPLKTRVPMVGIPMFGEQQWNIEQAALKGYAVSLSYQELSEEKLSKAIEDVLYKAEYRQKANFAAQLYRDQLESPLDRAVYWVEYVLRYQGATHLRSVGRDLSFIQYYSLDVISFFIGILALAAVIIALALRAFLRLVLGSSKNKKLKKKTQ